MHGWRVLVLVLLGTSLMVSPVLAQEATPAPDTGDNPRIVAPAECVVGPRSVDEISAWLALDGDGVPAPAMMTITPPLGTVVEVEVSIPIKEAAREIIACFNAGDIPRAAALMTENGVKRAFWGLTIDAASRELAKTRLAAAPRPRADIALTRLITVTDESVMPDGRIAAFVVINDPLLPPDGPETLLFVFANQDGAWLVDDLVDFSIVSATPPTRATPAP